MMDFEEFRQRLFLQICDKKDLDLKGENLKNYDFLRENQPF